MPIGCTGVLNTSLAWRTLSSMLHEQWSCSLSGVSWSHALERPPNQGDRHSSLGIRQHSKNSRETILDASTRGLFREPVHWGRACILLESAGAEQMDLVQLQSGVFKEETTKKRGVGGDSCHREGGVRQQFMAQWKVTGYLRQT